MVDLNQLNNRNISNITKILNITTITENTLSNTYSDYLTTGLTISLEAFSLVCICISIGVLIEDYMIPCLQNLGKKYKLSEEFSGYILAVGASIPEFTTNLIASTNKNSMIDLGVGTVTGSGIYALFVNYDLNPDGLQLNKRIFYKESIVYLLTLGLILIFLYDDAIDIYELLILCCLSPFYIYAGYYFSQSPTKEKEKSEEIQDFSNNKLHLHIPNLESEGVHPDQELTVFNNSGDQDEGNDINAGPEEEGSFLYRAFDKFQKIIALMFGFLNIFNSYPVVMFIIISFMVYIQIQTIISFVEDLSSRTSFTPALLGLTIIAWSGNVGDCINSSIFAKKGIPDLMVTTIIASQIMNLQICLAFPWLLSILLGIRTKIEFENELTKNFFKIAFVGIFIAVAVMALFGMKLNKQAGLILLIVYIISIVYQVQNEILM